MGRNGFTEFVATAKESGVPVVTVPGGRLTMYQCMRASLTARVGHEQSFWEDVAGTFGGTEANLRRGGTT